MRIKNLVLIGSDNIVIFIYLGILIVGTLIGLLSSGFALRRYLRV